MSRTSLIGLDGLTKEVNKTLMLYKKNCVNEVLKTAKEVAKETVETLKAKGDYEDKTGDYRKAFALKAYNYYTYAGATVYVKPPHYRLTHLLEHGHMKANGTGRTKAFPHWEPASVISTKEFQRRLTERIGDIKV